MARRFAGWRYVAAALLAAAVACAPRTPPAAPGATVWRQPDVPRDLAARGAETAKYQEAWSRIRGGDVRGGERDLDALNRIAPPFYPAAASLGELRLQRREYREAAALFDQALAANRAYLPALIGLVDARLGAGDDAGALGALKALLAADPSRTEARSRLDIVALRVSQNELAQAERLRSAGQLDEAERHLTSALTATPENGPVLRALATVEFARGQLDGAAGHVRAALTLDPQDAASLALLGDILDAQGHLPDAAAAYTRAIAIDPRPAWRDRKAQLQERADAVSLPENYRAIPAAASVTRAQVAAMLGIRLAPVLQRAPARVTDVATDVRSHWAAAWILPVTRAGWMDILPNHTFQPAGIVHRADLARIVAAVLTATLAARGKTPDGGGKAFADVPRDHAAYRVIAIAVAAGIMSADANNRFQPAGVVSGAELIATVTRLEALAK